MSRIERPDQFFGLSVDGSTIKWLTDFDVVMREALNVPRFAGENYPEGVFDVGGDRRETLADHINDLLGLAGVVKNEFPVLDKDKLITYAIVHDADEILGGDKVGPDKGRVGQVIIEEEWRARDRAAPVLIQDSLEAITAWGEFAAADRYLKTGEGKAEEMKSEALVAVVMDKFLGNVFASYYLVSWYVSNRYSSEVAMREDMLRFPFEQYRVFKENLEKARSQVKEVVLEAGDWLLERMMQYIDLVWSFVPVERMPEVIREELIDYRDNRFHKGEI